MISVILADDHAIVRDGLQALLRAADDMIVIGQAAEGRAAVHLVDQLRPDVVVMDIAMPSMNGIEATQRIHQRYPETQVVILSMNATAELIYRSFQAGALAFLVKDSVGTDLIEAIRSVASGKRYLGQNISERLLDAYLRQRAEAPEASPLERLTPREREVLQLVAEGKSSTEISEILALSPKTITTYRSRLMHKLNIHDLPGLIKFAIQYGLTALE
jgi:DNA-binding NarL/FixJ family response regulator